MLNPTIGKLRTIVFVSIILLGIGLFAPCMTIVPQYGEFSFLIKLFKPEYGKTQVFSIAGGILQLFGERQYLVAAVLLLFSVLFPLWKMGVMLDSINSIAAGHSAKRSLHIIERLGKFSMLDIFVIALLVLAIKGLPGGTEVRINWGVAAFALSVLISMKVPHWICDLEKKWAPEKGDSDL